MGPKTQFVPGAGSEEVKERGGVSAQARPTPCCPPRCPFKLGQQHAYAAPKRRLPPRRRRLGTSGTAEPRGFALFAGALSPPPPRAPPPLGGWRAASLPPSPCLAAVHHPPGIGSGYKNGYVDSGWAAERWTRGEVDEKHGAASSHQQRPPFHPPPAAIQPRERSRATAPQQHAPTPSNRGRALRSTSRSASSGSPPVSGATRHGEQGWRGARPVPRPLLLRSAHAAFGRSRGAGAARPRGPHRSSEQQLHQPERPRSRRHDPLRPSAAQAAAPHMRSALEN